MRDKILEVQAWARQKIKAGQEPPWVWYQLMKLDEAISEIVQQSDGVRAITLVHDADCIPVQMPGTSLEPPE